MGMMQQVSVLVARHLAVGACKAAGIEGASSVARLLTSSFTDHSQKVTAALADANNRAWKTLEIALAGDSWCERVKLVLAAADEKAFRQQVRAFLDAAPLEGVSADAGFRQQCLYEIQDARKKKLLTEGFDPKALAGQIAGFARFSDPSSLLKSEEQTLRAVAEELSGLGYTHLPFLLRMTPGGESPMLLIAARYFFRRAVETDSELFQGLAWSKIELLNEVQERGFRALDTTLSEHAARLEEMLGDVRSVAVETRNAVLDLSKQIERLGKQSEERDGQSRQVLEAVLHHLNQHRLDRREVRPGDSLSIRDDGEKKLVRQVIARYRALPEADRERMPALLNAIGKLEHGAGDFAGAQKDFQAVARMVDDDGAKAEANFNSYRAALEQENWEASLSSLIGAIKLDPKRFAPFPVGKYHPVRILGAGGFGVAFLCRHKHMEAFDVVKTLSLDDIGRDADTVFAEAQLLRQLDHPAIIRISTCGYVEPLSKSRPYLVMDYFDGHTLEGHVKKNGPLTYDDFMPIARQIAEALQAAHGQKILHRDVKPANVLVRQETSGWRVKVIDFGLAMRQKVLQTSRNTGVATGDRTLLGSSIAGTLEYAAPEQMGRRKDVIGPHSDVYGFAKTCCYALFQTTQPLLKHWNSIPLPLAKLLEKCLEEDPRLRPSSFGGVLKSLTEGDFLPVVLESESVRAEERGAGKKERPTTGLVEERKRTSGSSRREKVAMTMTDDQRPKNGWLTPEQIGLFRLMRDMLAMSARDIFGQAYYAYVVIKADGNYQSAMEASPGLGTSRAFFEKCLKPAQVLANALRQIETNVGTLSERDTLLVESIVREAKSSAGNFWQKLIQRGVHRDIEHYLSPFIRQNDRPPLTPERSGKSKGRPVESPIQSEEDEDGTPLLWVVLSLFLCLPLGIYIVWTNPNWTTRKKGIWTGVSIALPIVTWIVIVQMRIYLDNIGYQESSDLRKREDREEKDLKQRKFNEANKAWETGDKAKAAELYRECIKIGFNGIENSEASVAYQRVIEQDVLKGNLSSAKALMKKARGGYGSVELAFTDEKCNQLLKEVEAKLAEDKRRIP